MNSINWRVAQERRLREMLLVIGGTLVTLAALLLFLSLVTRPLQEHEKRSQQYAQPTVRPQSALPPQEVYYSSQQWPASTAN